jgi:hypothetical protein
MMKRKSLEKYLSVPCEKIENEKEGNQDKLGKSSSVYVRR